jgi:diguanylate cyclase (GGDEF)-like protein
VPGGRGPGPVLDRRLRVRRPVRTDALWLCNLALLAAGVEFWRHVVEHLHAAPALHLGDPWWALVIAFYLAEVASLRIRFRRDPDTISLREVALVLGLYALRPESLLLAQILGAGAGLISLRRQPPSRIVFNLARLTLTTSVAIAVFRELPGLAHAFAPAGWGAALAACLAATLLGLLLSTAAIAVSEGALVLAPGAAAVSILSTAAITDLTLVAIQLARAEPSSTVLLALPALIGGLSLIVLGERARRHEHLEFLYASMKATQGAPEFGLAVGRLLIAVRELVRAEYAEIFLFPVGVEQGLRSTLGRQGEMTAHADVLGADDERVLAALAESGETILLPSPRAPHPLDGYLGARKVADALITTLTGEQGPLGLLLVGERSRELGSFDQDDRRLLETFAGHASVMLQKGRLARSLAELTDLKERLRHQAFHDPLTGLPNRSLLRERVEAAIAQPGGSAAVLFLDLDDFKTINDHLGHAVGDEVLVEVARRIQRCLRQSDTAGRLGGDEFAVLLESADQGGAETVARSLLEAMERPFDLAGRQTRLRASIGIALATSAASADELLGNADLAMYSAKAAGKHDFRQYAPKMHARVRRRHEFALDLEGALERDEISLAFEPIVDLHDGRIVAVEALARWNSIGRGVVSPARFIPVAEEMGLMVPIGRSVLRRACEAARRWHQPGEGSDAIAVSVNLSASELASPTLVEEVGQALAESGLPPERLALELTESDVMRTLGRAGGRMQELGALGVRLILDDFGTGHSSLERLDTFPVDAVKIAKPFVDRLLDSSAGTPFIDAFVRLTRSLEMQCIAEGVEHDAQVPRLLELGCTFGQGYHFARAMRAEEIEARLGLASGPLRRAS